MTPFRTVVQFCVLSLVDMVGVVLILCYQVAFQRYFAWHLYPLMLNRAVELMAFICSSGTLPASYSLLQLPLAVTSAGLYMSGKPYVTSGCAVPFAMYAILMSYQFFVALLVVKHRRDFALEQRNMERLAIILAARAAARLEARAEELRKQDMNKVRDVYVAVEMPDGELNSMVARLCRPPRVELPDSGDDNAPAHQEQPTPKPDPSMEAEVQPLDQPELSPGAQESFRERGSGGLGPEQALIQLQMEANLSVDANWADVGGMDSADPTQAEVTLEREGPRREASLTEGDETDGQ